MSNLLTFIAFGANKGQPLKQILSALEKIATLESMFDITCSSIYTTPPMGPQQPDYLNGVFSCQFSGSPQDLLIQLQLIEQYFGRNRAEEVRWGPRPLDLDILLFKDLKVSSQTLQIPHPGLYNRPFVLTPLAEIAPCYILPNGQTVAAMATIVEDPAIRRVYDSKGVKLERHN